MSKELFVTSTPHETKLAVVEDDQVVEVFFERENEYTLAGSIYKGRVTRVLPGMQSAFVDIGLERDAFLYVSDFMDLEEHDDDLTDAVPANRGVQDMRPQPVRAEEAPLTEEGVEGGNGSVDSPSENAEVSGSQQEEGNAPAQLSGSPTDAANGNEGRERGSWRGRRRRRGGR